MDSNELQMKLKDLKGSGTPLGTLSNPNAADLAFLEQITVGNEFQDLLNETLTEINDLNVSHSAYEKIISGTFGTGKTHFGLLLYKKLVDANEDNRLIITFDFSDIGASPSNFQSLMISGLRIEGGQGYQYACRRIFERILSNISEANSYEENNKNTFKDTVKFIVSKAYKRVQDSFVGEMIDDKFGNEIKSALRGEKLNQLISEFESETTHEFNEFIETLADLVANPDRNSDKFKEAVQKLSDDYLLIDILFGLIKSAGYTSIVIIADEVESLKSRDFTRQVFNIIRNFRDACFAKAGRVYPSMALVFLCTPALLADTIRTEEPALWRRWENNISELPEPDIEETVGKFTNLAIDAHMLNSNMDTQQIINKLEQESERKMLTMADIVTRLVTELLKKQG